MDPLLLTVQIMLAALGLLGVASAEPSELVQHGFRLAGAIGITLVVSRVPAKRVIKASPYAYALVVGLLLIVLIVGIASGVSRRWLLIGNITIQPSELMKVTVIAYLAAFFHNHLGNWQIWRPMLVIGAAAGLIVAEPDVSTALFIFALAFAIMLAAGTTITRLLSISTAAALIAILVAGPYVSQLPYVKDRIVGFLDSKGSQEQTESIGYQADRARQALQRAGLFGVGPGRPFDVPEDETDLIAVSIGQAAGLIGIGTLVALFLVIAGRGLRIATSRTGPASLLAAGATTYICGQAALNLLVAAGLFPITGIPLPMVSVGLNSLVSVSIAMGFIHASYREARAAGVKL